MGCSRLTRQTTNAPNQRLDAPDQSDQGPTRMVHRTHHESPFASAWCDDCGSPNPVVFRRLTDQRGTDVHSMCAACWGKHVAFTMLTKRDRGIA